MLRIKRPLVVIALLLMLMFIVYDNIKPPEDTAFEGKVITLTGKVTEIKKYEVPFGESSFKLRIENGPKELPAFFVKIKEGRLLKACKIEKQEEKYFLRFIF